MDRGIFFRPLTAFFAVAFVAVPPANASSENQSFSDARAAFGKKNGVHYEMGAVQPSPTPSDAPAENGGESDLAGFYAVLQAMLLGKDRSILETQASMTTLLEG